MYLLVCLGIEPDITSWLQIWIHLGWGEDLGCELYSSQNISSSIWATREHRRSMKHKNSVVKDTLSHCIYITQNSQGYKLLFLDILNISATNFI